ncbi:MAG: cupin domain-containing protein [Parachlamydiales bacterium]|nr:cupin domain-containing protein [Parachlamydiales bacterium]
MSDKNLVSKIFKYDELVDYQSGSIVSRTIISKEVGTVTLFAFDKDQKLSTHTAPYQALLQVIEGIGRIIIDGKEYILEAPAAIIMPANVPHSVHADKKFKMLLTMIKAK